MAKPTKYQQEYYQKLKDPRWQKKRLEVMQRDGFSCQICFDTDSTLNVHHRRYIQGNEPWEYENYLLVTLCESCHKKETEDMPGAVESFSNSTKDFYLSEDISRLEDALRYAALYSKSGPAVISKALSELMSDREFVSYIEDEYFKIVGKNSLKKNRGRKV
jgi:5-methylcytosine-specific restriction endonuclease McrA